MSIVRRCLLARAAVCLNVADEWLHLVPQVVELHGQVREQQRDSGEWVPLSDALRIWWRAHCIERSVHHAIRAEACRR